MRATDGHYFFFVLLYALKLVHKHTHARALNLYIYIYMIIYSRDCLRENPQRIYYNLQVPTSCCHRTRHDNNKIYTVLFIILYVYDDEASLWISCCPVINNDRITMVAYELSVFVVCIIIYYVYSRTAAVSNQLFYKMQCVYT